MFITWYGAVESDKNKLCKILGVTYVTCITVKEIKNCIISARGELDSDMIDMMYPDFWKSKTGGAGRSNRSDTAKRVAAFTEALAKANNSEIQV